MVNDWEEVTLGDILTLQRGFDLSKANRVEGYIPIVASNGIVDWHDEFKVKAPGVVIGRSGSIGGGQYIEEDFWPLNTTLWVKDFKGNNERFCYYLLLNIDFQMFNVGSGVPTLNRNHIHPLPISVPPVIEQKAIAHILGSLDDKIELNRQINETLEAMAQALFKSWFIDFDPVIDNALAAGNAIPDEFAERAEHRKGIEKKDNTDIQSLFPDEFEFAEEMGWIPKGWRISPLTEVIDFLEGPGIRNWQYTEEEDGIKFINIRCIQDGDIKLATANKITKEEAFGKYEHFQLEVDDIVVSASGTLGRYAFVRKEHLPLSLNTSVIRFRPIEGISTLYYIAGYIDTKLQFELETRATGSAQRNFGPMHLKQISMLLPPINILEKHLELAKRLFSKRKSSLEQVETLTKLRDTLLPKLMSGELRIPDATALVENV
jgi:type I restriction enzyme S subunit